MKEYITTSIPKEEGYKNFTWLWLYEEGPENEILQPKMSGEQKVKRQEEEAEELVYAKSNKWKIKGHQLQ